MELLASEIEVIDELRSETYSLEYANFKRTWLLYDEAETGKMSTDETENCVRKMLSDVQIESFSPYKEVISEVLNRNAKDNQISILDVAILLPTTADVFIKFYDMDEDIQTSSVDFLRIWKDFDTDANGALDKVETSELVLKMIENIVTRYEECCGLKHRKLRLDVTLLNSFVNELFIIGDSDKNGFIELRELAAILNVEKNFLDICPKKLQQKHLSEIFAHYDKDGSGSVEGAEFLAFVRDVIRIDSKPLSRLTRKESDVDAEELELAGSMIMGLVDEDNDGKLDKSEMGVVMEKKPPKLIKNQTTFIKLQKSFDQGDI